jgi:peptidoglycan/xylan/chitin deacetylase (PgdA/CDA1 family)
MLIFTYHTVLAPGARPVGFYDVSADALGWQIDALRARGFSPYDPAAPPGPSTYVLTFDDGTRGHFDHAFPVLRERREHAVFFIPTADIGQPGRVTATEVRALAGEGQIIGCHSHEHRRLDTLEPEAVRAQLTTSCGQLRGLTGAPVEWFAPPGGFVNAIVRREAVGLGLRWLRGMRWGRNGRLDPHDLECLPLNRHLDSPRFVRFIEGRGLAALHAAYLAKQLLKRLLPLPLYTRLRRRLPFGGENG